MPRLPYRGKSNEMICLNSPTRSNPGKQFLCVSGKDQQNADDPQPTEPVLDAAFLSRATPVMGNRRAVFNRLNIQACGLQRCNGTLASASRAFDFDINFLDTKLQSFFSSLLSGALTCKWRAFSAAFEAASSCTGPTQGFTLGVGNGDRRVVKGCLNMGHPVGHIASDAFLLCLCHGKNLSRCGPSRRSCLLDQECRWLSLQPAA